MCVWGGTWDMCPPILSWHVCVGGDMGHVPPYIMLACVFGGGGEEPRWSPGCQYANEAKEKSSKKLMACPPLPSIIPHECVSSGATSFNEATSSCPAYNVPCTYIYFKSYEPYPRVGLLQSSH